MLVDSDTELYGQDGKELRMNPALAHVRGGLTLIFVAAGFTLFAGCKKASGPPAL